MSLSRPIEQASPRRTLPLPEREAVGSALLLKTTVENAGSQATNGLSALTTTKAIQARTEAVTATIAYLAGNQNPELPTGKPPRQGNQPLIQSGIALSDSVVSLLLQEREVGRSPTTLARAPVAQARYVETSTIFPRTQPSLFSIAV